MKEIYIKGKPIKKHVHIEEKKRYTFEKNIYIKETYS